MIKNILFSALVALGSETLATPALAQPTGPQAEVLRTWYFAHVQWPYPTQNELAALAAETRLPAETVRFWLTRTKADHEASVSDQDVPASAQAPFPQAAPKDLRADLDPVGRSSASALQPPAAVPEISQVELRKPSSASAAQGHLDCGSGIITGSGFGSDPMAVEVTFIEKHGGFYTFEHVLLLSDDKIHFALGDEPCNLTRGRFLVRVNGKPSTPKAAVIPPPAAHSPGAAAAASAASQAHDCSPGSHQASRKRKGASPDQEQAASASSSSSGSEGEGSSSGSESDNSSISRGASSPDGGAGSAAAPRAKKPRHYSALFKQTAMKAYLEAKGRGDATVTMNDVSISLGVPRRTLSNWLAAAGRQPRWPTRTYSPEEKAAALSTFRQKRGLGYSQVEAAQSSGVPIASVRNWDLGRAMDQKAYSMAEKAAYRTKISEALAGGASLESIAEDLGIPPTTVRNWAKKGPPRAAKRASSAGAAAAAAAPSSTGVAPKLP